METDIDNIETPKSKVHHGYNVRRLRQILDVKQGAIAKELGITQQNVSRLEQKESIDKDTLGKIAKALNVPIEAIENFTDDNSMCSIETFNNKVAHLVSNAASNSQSACAKYVRQAIEAGGLSTTGRPNYAKNYTTFLPSIGFSEIPITGYTPIKGDIIVLQNVKGGHVAGHIAMYSGSQWISDFKQRDQWGGTRYRNAQKDNTLIYNYYRWQ